MTKKKGRSKGAKRPGAKRPSRIRDPRRVENLKELPRIEITWHDAASGDGTWLPFDHLRSQNADGLMECQTLGYLVKMGPKAIMLCQTRAENGKLAHDWSIPRKWVKKIRILR